MEFIANIRRSSPFTRLYLTLQLVPYNVLQAYVHVAYYPKVHSRGLTWWRPWYACSKKSWRRTSEASDR